MNAAKRKCFAPLSCCLLLFLAALPCAHAQERGAPDKKTSIEFAKMPPCNLPEKVATGFSDVMQRLVGASYTPVLYVGRQLSDNGAMRHLIVCRQVISALGAPEHLVLVTLEHKADGSSLTGTWAIASIERIV